ncbi:MAG TPA: LysM peptidoglycan-binding domain-containing protein [Candidatus Dormibacteraeota bacterium]|nr:LysM peptidoglycan-binding domain-containing protein [Candidatus Dormibacteraeota bacterium]
MGRRRAWVAGAAVAFATVVAWAPAPAASAGGGDQEVCRLPVSTGTQLGFVSYPAGTFTAEPGPRPVLPSSAGSAVTNYGYAFDAALSTWVPVTQNLVSPDGREYVYGDLQVVDVESGAETQLAASLNYTWHPIAWEPDGIYAITVGSNGAAPGLWLVSYPAGDARQIIDSGYWEAASHGAAYGIIDTNPPADKSTAMNRVDARSGAVTKWFYLAGSRSPYIAGFDESGAPVIQQSVAVFVVPTAMQPILVTPNTHASTAIGDRLGIWIGNSAGVFLFAGGTFTRVTDLAAAPVGVCLSGASTPPPPPPSRPATYTVRPGDTLSGIARAFGLSSYLPLFWRNEQRPQPGGGVLTDPNLIRPGWVLEIPKEPLPTYVVRGGDTLGSIAARFYGNPAWWRGIFDANRDRLSNPDVIFPGQKLRIP